MSELPIIPDSYRDGIKSHLVSNKHFLSMDFFEKHKALIITILFCSVLVLGLFNFGLSKKRQQQQEMLVDLENFTREERAEEPPQDKAEEEKKIADNNQQTHRAFNENQEARKDNFNKQLDKVLDPKSAKQEKASANNAKNINSGDYKMGRESEQSKEKSQGNDQTRAVSNQSGSLRNSSISFSLRGRKAIAIPNPIYTCDTPGKIVVNITVNSRGRVKSTGINKASSNSDNECLTKKAMEYAANAVFSSLSGRNDQPGTITYNFKP